jgi:membrane associated rhomboid family serine protease
MLLPISHEKMSTRRVPVVTVVLIVLTVVLHAVSSIGTAAREERAMSAMMAARLLYLQRPSLGLCAPLRPFVGQPAAADGTLADLVEKLSDDTDRSSLTQRYEAACKELADSLDGIAAQRFGYVPARANLLGLFTYAFVHADWWHVIGNMWFLFLCGLALEDRWGRLPFAVFYVVASVAAAAVHHLALSSSTAALIGASGAVAGAMGAFVVLFARTKIRFVGFLGFRLVWFAAPAYVMLPLWAAVELGYGLLTRSSGTAHWAHLGGFAFGLLVAGLFRMVGVDRRLDDAVERAAVLGNDPRVDAARALAARGGASQAIALLEGLAKEKPESIHVWRVLHEIASEHGDEGVAAEAARRVAMLETERGWASSSLVKAEPAPRVPTTSAARTSPASTAPRASTAARTSTAAGASTAAHTSTAAGGASPAGPAAAPEVAPFFPAPPPNLKAGGPSEPTKG